MLSGIVRFAVIHSHGFVPPYLNPPGSAGWQAWFDGEYDKTYARFGGLLTGVFGAYLVCYRKDALQRFFARKRTVTILALLGLGAHIALTPLASGMFRQMPPWAGQLWMALHRDVLSLATMFLILAAIFAPGVLGGRLRGVLGWKGFYPVAQLSYSTYLVSEMVFVWMFPKTAPVLKGTFGAYGTMALDSLMALVLIVALTTFLYVTVERPGMEMRSLPAIRDLGWRKAEALPEPAAG
jgi:peptidoglycan/LPS O-acetylase OafA/YrhL